MNRPFVRLKIAASLDGRTALNNGVSQWITGPEARQDGHRWRAQADAILTGVGTILADNPLLDVRGVEVPRQPALVIVDSRLRTPPEARVFDADRPVFIYTAECDTQAHRRLESRGATIVDCPATGPSAVDLHRMMADLHQRDLHRVHVEAGPGLNAGLLRGLLVDEWLIYLAPTLLGPGQPLAQLPELSDLQNAIHAHWIDVQSVGTDLRLRARAVPPPT